MGAVLVATAGDKKIYYVVDSKDSSKDGVIEDADGKTTEVPFFSYIGKTTGIRPIRSTEFHKFLWDEPSEKNKKRWMETFILKVEEPDKNEMDGVVVQDSTGKARKKKTNIDRKANAFMNNNHISNSYGLQFSTKMILSDIKREK
jgi:hypothetical protein